MNVNAPVFFVFFVFFCFFFLLSFLHERHVGVGTTYKGTVGSLSNVSICGGGGGTNRGVIRGV